MGERRGKKAYEKAKNKGVRQKGGELEGAHRQKEGAVQTESGGEERGGE